MFQERTLDMLNKKTADVINSFGIKGRIRLIGSNSLRSTQYGSDYDIESIIKGVSLAKIAEHLQKEYAKASNNLDIWITDFKCGHDPRLVYKGDYTDQSLKKYLKNKLIKPAKRKAILGSSGEERIDLVRSLFILRWTAADIKKGEIKLIDGTTRSLETCLGDKTTTKIDLIVKVGNQFAEISENYYIKVGNQSNYSAVPTKAEQMESLEEDIHFYSKVDTFKSLKRLFSLFQLEGKTKYKEQLKTLVDFFNSQTGYLNKIKNEMVILEVLLKQPRKPRWEDVVANIQFIKSQIGDIYEIPLNDKVFSDLDGVNPQNVLSIIQNLRSYFSEKINQTSKVFLQSYI
jgi:truncated hemoglobin YjbI